MTPADFFDKWSVRVMYPWNDAAGRAELDGDLAALLAEREQAIREECATIAESMTDGVHVVLCENIAAAIRARVLAPPASP